MSFITHQEWVARWASLTEDEPPFPTEDWVEDMTTEQTLDWIKTCVNWTTRQGYKNRTPHMMLSVGNGGENVWMDVSRSWAKEFIQTIGDAQTQYRNGLSTTRFRMTMHLAESLGYSRLSIWPHRHFNKRIHSDSCSCKGGERVCQGFGEEEEE